MTLSGNSTTSTQSAEYWPGGRVNVSRMASASCGVTGPVAAESDPVATAVGARVGASCAASGPDGDARALRTTTKTIFDARGHAVSETYATGAENEIIGRWSADYDLDRVRLQRYETDDGTQQTKYSYDDRGRLTALERSGGANDDGATAQWSYDGAQLQRTLLQVKRDGNTEVVSVRCAPS